MEMLPFCRGLFLLVASIALVSPSLLVDQHTSGHAGRYQPALQPSQSVPDTGTYLLETTSGKLCLKATMGLGYTVIIEKKSWYYNVDPSMVLVSGHCGTNAVTLSLTLPNNSASLQLTYSLVDSVSYVSRLSTHISPQPACNGCSSRTYPGGLSNISLFQTPPGQSYQCSSQVLLVMTEELQVRLVPLQLQAFKVPDGGYGQEVMCPADYNRAVVPTILWATACGLVLIAVLTYLLVKDRRGTGYQRL
ncbi:unnamed protein product [Arctogadus glacialis]